MTLWIQSMQSGMFVGKGYLVGAATMQTFLVGKIQVLS